MTRYSIPSSRPPGSPGPSSDPAQEALIRALRASFNILRVLMVVLVVLYVLSGLFRVEPGQQGLVSRFGQLRTTVRDGSVTPVFAPGWHAALPDPFDTKYTLTGQLQGIKVTTFMFAHPQAATEKDLSRIVGQSGTLTPGLDGAMFTGDRNLSHGRWEVEYTIDDAALFIQNVGNTPAAFESLLQRLTETAVVREVSGRTVEQVTRTALDAVRQGVRRRLQAALDELETGVQVAQVVALTIEPGPVRPAFLDVMRAESERLSLQERAEEEAAEILNQAAGGRHRDLIDLITAYGDAQLQGADEADLDRHRSAIDAMLTRARREGAGQVAVKLSAAEARADQINESLRSEYEQFRHYRAQSEAQPRITPLALWVQMRQRILSNRLNEIFFVPDAQEIEVHIKSDEQRKIELAEEAAREQRRP